MTDQQHAKLASYGTVETVLDAHPTVLTGVAATRDVTAFRTLLADLRAAAAAQSDYAPQSKAKEAHFEAMVTAAVPISQALAVWAEDQGDLALADQIAFTRTDFVRARERDALDRASLVLDTTRDAPDIADYEVTREAIAHLDACIDTFADAIDEPRHAVAERSANTREVERLFPAIDRHLERRLDRHVARLHGTPFYTEYHAARRIVDR